MVSEVHCLHDCLHSSGMHGTSKIPSGQTRNEWMRNVIQTSWSRAFKSTVNTSRVCLCTRASIVKATAFLRLAQRGKFLREKVKLLFFSMIASGKFSNILRWMCQTNDTIWKWSPMWIFCGLNEPGFFRECFFLFSCREARTGIAWRAKMKLFPRFFTIDGARWHLKCFYCTSGHSYSVQ